MNLYRKMCNRTIAYHNPKPSYRTYIKKKNGKLRPLSIPVIIDRIWQNVMKMALEPQWEYRFEPTSYGFRPERGCHDAIERIYKYLVFEMCIRDSDWLSFINCASFNLFRANCSISLFSDVFLNLAMLHIDRNTHTVSYTHLFCFHCFSVFLLPAPYTVSSLVSLSGPPHIPSAST